MAGWRERSPGWKLFIVALIAGALMVPLLMVYALVWDRQQQSQTARQAITAGWGGDQLVAGPVLVIPYSAEAVETVTENGRETTRAVRSERELFVSPVTHQAEASLAPERRARSIYSTVLYTAQVRGVARFVLPPDLARFGVRPEALALDRAELRFGVSDARGLQSPSELLVEGRPVPLQPGKGLGATGGSGFFAFVPRQDTQPIEVRYAFHLNGSGQFAFVPRGGDTRLTVRSPWPSPSFAGSFLPATREVSARGFVARYSVPDLALGQALVTSDDAGPPLPLSDTGPVSPSTRAAPSTGGASAAAAISLIDPVDLYAQVNRSVKYGFLFIAFTFLAFLMFDLVGGARVAAAEYLLTGAGLVLFFVLLLALAEIIGFTPAYLLAAGAIIGLLTAYSAAVLGSRARAAFIGGLLVALYAVLYVLLSLEAYSLLVGSLLLFAALAVVMYATRNIDWTGARAGTAADSLAPSA